jgi:hypothetical protein
VRVEWAAAWARVDAGRAEVAGRLDEGWTVGQIADATGWSIAQVKMWRKRMCAPERLASAPEAGVESRQGAAARRGRARPSAALPNENA